MPVQPTHNVEEITRKDKKGHTQVCLAIALLFISIVCAAKFSYPITPVVPTVSSLGVVRLLIPGIRNIAAATAMKIANHSSETEE